MGQAIISLEEFNNIESLDQKIAILSQNIGFIMSEKKASSEVDSRISDFKPLVKKGAHVVDIPKSTVPKIKKNLNKIEIIDESKDKKESRKVSLRKKALITVPTFLVKDLGDSLSHHTEFVKDAFHGLSSTIKNAFTVSEESERLKNIKLADKLQKLERKKIIKAKRADVKFALEQERLALKHSKRLRTKLSEPQVINRSQAYVETIPKGKLALLKEALQYNYGVSYSNYLEKLNDIKRVNSIRVANKLQEEENKRQRKNAIDDMIAALKAQDIEEEIEEKRTNGIRISR